MGANFQDVLRDVHDPSVHALKISGTINAAGQATVTVLGLPTVTVSNPAAAASTVFVGTPTLFAVVNTGAAGVGNSIVTVANPNFGINAGVNNIGFATVTQVNQPALVASNAFIGLTTAVIGSSPTIFAVVNTGGANTGNITLNPSPNQIGSVTVSNPVSLGAGVANIGFASVTPVKSWPDPTTYIGLVTATLAGSVNTGMTTIFPGPNFIGLVTATLGSMVTVTLGTTLDATKDTVGVGQWYPTLQSLASGGLGPIAVDVNGRVLIGDSKGYIGLVTVTQASAARTITGNVTLSDSKSYIGLVTTTLGAGISGIGFATVTLINQPALVASSANIGSVSVLGGTINSVLQTSTLNIGSVSILGGSIVNAAGVAGIGFVTAKLDAGTQFIGLVTAWARNAGTTKTLVNLPVGLGNNSLATVAVPTNSNKINLTQLILNSNVTTEIAIKSGVTYLTGNASLGVTLFPGGGFVMNGSPDSPVWISLPSGAAVIEKRDPGGTVSKIGGHVVYFDE